MKILLKFISSPKTIIYYIRPVMLMLASLVYGAEGYLLSSYDRQLQEVFHPDHEKTETVSCSFPR